MKIVLLILLCMVFFATSHKPQLHSVRSIKAPVVAAHCHALFSAKTEDNAC